MRNMLQSFFTPAVAATASPMLYVVIANAFLASLGSLTMVWMNADRAADHARVSALGMETHFDFIIIGSGTAGSVLANRLSENPKWKILLLEAGGEPHPLQVIPPLSNFLLNFPATDWMHRTVPQKAACRGLLDGRSGWSQGKSLGGTGNLNYLIYLRGSPQDYNNWGKVTGDPSWSYDGVLPYFRKTEDFRGEWTNRIGGDNIHGTGGPVRVQLPDYLGLGEEFVQAGIEMGYKKVDLNGNYTEGFDKIYLSLKKGQRCGSFKAYVKPARQRPNLKIYKYAHVNKILIRGRNNRAYGVEFDRHGKRYTAIARNEVILSAGAIQSPKILMLSGIGPKAHLESKHIKVLQDLPGVGKNLQDHITVYLGPFETAGKTFLFDRDTKPSQLTEYLASGTGYFTASGVHAGAVISSSIAKANGEWDWPDLQLLFFGGAVSSEFVKGLEHAFHVNSTTSKKYYEHSLNKDSFIIVASLGRPRGRGDITLKSEDPYAELLIDPKYLEDDQDIKVLVEGARMAMNLAENTPTFKKLNTSFTSAVWPGCESHVFKSDEYLECFIRQVSITFHHIVGTCAMGSKNSKEAVVDTQLRVKGVKNLRVIDASVMPVVPVTNTQAPVFMIAEKGADFIKKSWGFS